MAKIATFNPKIGYPDKWKDYSKVAIRHDAFFEDYLAARRFVVEEIAHVHERARLLRHGVRDRRMRVPERADRDPGDAIEILAPGIVPKHTPVAAHQRNRRPIVVAQQCVTHVR